MKLPRQPMGIGLVTMLCVLGFVGTSSTAPAVPSNLKGQFQVLDLRSTHVAGKVKFAEFADFYCPHCHHFEQSVVPVLEEEFGNQLEVTLVGFPVIPGKLPTAFEMYEQAKMMGKGPEMKRVLFRTIHEDNIQVLDRVIRESLIKEVGLDPVEFEAGLASGKPTRAFYAGKRLGEKVGVQHTPTIVLDGNIKVEALDAKNLRMVIGSILAADQQR